MAGLRVVVVIGIYMIIAPCQAGLQINLHRAIVGHQTNGARMTVDEAKTILGFTTDSELADWLGIRPQGIAQAKRQGGELPAHRALQVEHEVLKRRLAATQQASADQG
jgi:hypothetical protein